MLAPPTETEMVRQMEAQAPGAYAALKVLADWYDAFCRPATAVGTPGWETLTLYHYTKAETLENIVRPVKRSGLIELWAGNLAGLNDRAEFILGWDVLYQTALRWPGPVPASLDRAIGSTMHRRAKDAYVLSLTRLRNDPEMWKEYGDLGRGVAIGFNLKALYEATGLFPIQITYDLENFCKRCWDSFGALCACTVGLERCWPEVTNLPGGPTPLQTILSLVALHYKHERWQREQEVRFFQWDLWGKEDQLRLGGSRFALDLDPRHCVTEVVAGPLCHGELLARVRTACEELGKRPSSIGELGE